MDDKYAKAIAKELRLIRIELEQMNGVQLTKDGPKTNMKALNRQLNKMEMREGRANNEK